MRENILAYIRCKN